MKIPEIIDIMNVKISALQDFVHIPYAQERQNFSQLLTFPGFLCSCNYAILHDNIVV